MPRRAVTSFVHYRTNSELSSESVAKERVPRHLSHVRIIYSLGLVNKTLSYDILST